MMTLKTHNILDYVAGVVIALSPWIFQFYPVEIARNLFLVLGLGLIFYSLFTDYRYSIAKVIPLGLHLALDCVVGIILLFAPWIFGYRGLIGAGQSAVHFILGIGALAMVALTRPRSGRGLDVDQKDFRRAA